MSVWLGILQPWDKNVVLTVLQSKISGALIHLVQKCIKSINLLISLIAQVHLSEILVLPRLQGENNVNQFAPNAVPIQVFKLLEERMLAIWNGRPVEVGAIADVGRSGSCGVALK